METRISISALAVVIGLSGLAQAAPKATPEQKAVASHLKALTTQKGNALYGVAKSSIKATNIKTMGSLSGTFGPDAGATISFSAKGLEKRDSIGGTKSFDLISVSGKYLSNSIVGPLVTVSKVTPEQAPIKTLE